MSIEAELGGMIVTWNAMAAGAARDVFFNKMMDFCMKHPGLVEKMVHGSHFIAIEFAKRAAAAAATAAAVAAGRTATYVAGEAFWIRFCANAVVMPKIPNPAVIGAGILGAAILAAGCSGVNPEDMKKAAPAYQAYMLRIMQSAVLSRKYHPYYTAHPTAKPFNEWYAEDY